MVTTLTHRTVLMARRVNARSGGVCQTAKPPRLSSYIRAYQATDAQLYQNVEKIGNYVTDSREITRPSRPTREMNTMTEPLIYRSTPPSLLPMFGRALLPKSHKPGANTKIPELQDRKSVV